MKVTINKVPTIGGIAPDRTIKWSINYKKKTLGYLTQTNYHTFFIKTTSLKKIKGENVDIDINIEYATLETIQQYIEKYFNEIRKVMYTKVVLTETAVGRGQHKETIDKGTVGLIVGVSFIENDCYIVRFNHPCPCFQGTIPKWGIKKN